ncbi:MAG TPA: phosphatase PAP2 family protein [Solirubrobacteraceae bacterium]|nr:phosphatase PAP2 family protein [Solirubrobacteraceae bacterium]
MLVAGPAVAVVSMLAALLTTDAAGLPLRDPDHVAGRRLLLVLGLVAVLVALDVFARASRRSGTLRPSLDAIRRVRRERWTQGRSVAVGTALVSFYLTYLAYRNLKSVVPVLRPSDLFDRQLADLDRALFGGHDPAVLLHDLLGTGLAAHVLSGGYMLFFAFIPVTLAVGLVFSRDLGAGLFYTTAQSINWLLGAGSYFLLPSLGPVYAEPEAFARLPVSGVTQLQDLLLDQRLEFLRDPAAGTAQSIAAFSSLHVSIFFTAVLVVHLLGLGRRVKIAAWLLLGVTIVSTIYLGWHYVLDDIGGLILGAMSVALACVLTGFKPRTGRRRLHTARTDRPRILKPHRSQVAVRLRPSPRSASWRDVLAGPLVAVVTVLAALLATRAVGLPLRDPDHVAALYLALVGFGTLVLVGLDIVVRAAHRSGAFPPSRAALRLVRRERWTLRAGVAAGTALVGFYATYLAYRNLKSVVPLLRPNDLFDHQLATLDRDLFGGSDPAALLHTLLGTGLTTHVLSTAYVAFIVFLPLTIGLALVFSRDLQSALFYTTAQSINWVLGIASYFLLPSLGPIYVDPGAFAALPASEVTHLQSVLLDQRVKFLDDPATGTPQSIAAFASLHVSMSFTAALAAHLLGLGRQLRIALWIWFAVTVVGTIYLGWHYVLDDVGGVFLGAIAVALARALTGIDLRGVRRWRRDAQSGVPNSEDKATARARAELVP